MATKAASHVLAYAGWSTHPLLSCARFVGTSCATAPARSKPEGHIAGWDCRYMGGAADPHPVRDGHCKGAGSAAASPLTSDFA
jgi:hypothetical protein